MIKLYTDGSCSPNPGKGGYGGILLFSNGVEEEYSGCCPSSTNIRMEMTAVIEGLKLLPEETIVSVYTDSNLVVQTMNSNWKRHTNRDLWKQLDNLVAARNVTFTHVKAHSGNKYNEIADQLANEARENGY